ncbi:MAG: MBL fold metallo-hydrolase [Persephonella sp.]|nr:MAG: MBL fold metallo-hydrolase [Persephonella sp.]RUM59137.1 MAG: MBL fold metallo-hydrolase [Persephonella sp.]
MIVKIITTGPIFENCILIFNEENKEVLVIDPGAEGGKIEEEIEGYDLKGILATHGHIDHIGQVGFLKRKFPDTPFYMNEKDIYLLNNELFPNFKKLLKAENCPEPDITIKEGSTIKFGRFNFYVIETPGHSPGSVCFYDNDYQLLITGDTIFKGSIGRTDLPGGSEKDLALSLQKLLLLPDETQIIPGHGEVSSLKYEKLYNRDMLELIQNTKVDIFKDLLK